MERRSGLLQAAEILLLVGGVLTAFSAIVFLGFALFATNLDALVDASSDEGLAEDIAGFRIFAIVYGGLALLMGLGSVFSLLGWRRVARGDLQGGFTFGLVGSLLPPVQIFSLLGAIFARVCPEATD